MGLLLLDRHQLLRNKNLADQFKTSHRKSIRISLTVALVGSLGVLLLGTYSERLSRAQPMKLAATEGA